MNRIVIAAVAIAAFLVVTGCSKETQPGAGLGGTVVGTGSDMRVTSTFWGYTPKDNKLAFIILTDFNHETAVGTVGGDWTGEIGSKNGRSIMVFERNDEGLLIGGTDYAFENGRVFLATAPKNVLSISQLPLPIGDSNYKTEIDRIVEQQSVQEFLNK